MAQDHPSAPLEAASETSSEPDKSGGLVGWFKERLSPKNGESVRDALEEIIDETVDEEATIDAHERVLIANVLRQRDVTAWDIMVPRVDVIAVAAETPAEDVLKQLVEEGHSRTPVYRETLDDVIGMVHIKDLAMSMSETSDGSVALQDVVRPVLFVSPSMRVLDLLLEMRLKRTHMALVIDEYGGTDGLVTIEDAVEQIVGEIEDEHDEEEEPELIVRPDGTLIADARFPLKEFEERFGQILDPEELTEIDTLGGLVFSLSGRVPARRELIAHKSGIEFEILDVDPRRIRRVRIMNLPETEEA